MGKKVEKFTERISFRATRTLAKKLKDEFEKSIYLKYAQFLRAIYDNHKANPDDVLAWKATLTAGKLYDELKAQGNNLNQLMKAINSGHVTGLSPRDKEVIQNVGLVNKKALDCLIKQSDL